MCALEHLWSSRRTNQQLQQEFKSMEIKSRRDLLSKTRRGRIQLMTEDLHVPGPFHCSKCGKRTDVSQLGKLPYKQLCGYLGYLIDTNQPLELQCCACMTKFINRHYIHIEEVKGLTLHGSYWLHDDHKSHAPKLILPRPPSELIQTALENMFDLPEGAEVYVGESEPIRIMISGRHFRSMDLIERRMYASGLLLRGL